MSPVLRAKSSLSPLATRGAWLTGGAVASLALVFAGVATPASASVTPGAGSVVAEPSNDDDCKKENGHHEKYQPEGKAQTPGGPLHEKCEDRDRDKQECSDIDSVAAGDDEEYSAVLTDGKAFVGQRRYLSSTPPGDYEWEELSDNRNYPKNACAISISADGEEAWVKVLTTNGRVYETHGDTDGSDFVWDERWKKLETPGEDDDDLTTREKGDLAPVQPNS
ncbi:hypothetical protein [Streptomyces liliifuscus]|uniref:Uncharacterized protein n=1 Tax=Streptomyces liliifuscus TaxID=2797636 RepID=A0A7T7I795_9ACTN|nr:hypothetical protein [Streptomyces liliifuscus]QQM42206.1 hypothetical protein JEQ17_24020 [Streptomyces liliifuscus]